mmetsp:Transcript_22266/g.39636  ORF Transcript_22266/g.39636 Transcript_22266/m.39636 type:complete len:96 (+) Transcript_22266:1091-1378(+)
MTEAWQPNPSAAAANAEAVAAIRCPLGWDAVSVSSVSRRLGGGITSLVPSSSWHAERPQSRGGGTCIVDGGMTADMATDRLWGAQLRISLNEREV